MAQGDTYTFYMGPNVRGEVVEGNGGYFVLHIYGSGPMYDSINDFRWPEGQTLSWSNVPYRMHQFDLNIGAGIETIADQCFDEIGTAYARATGEAGVENVYIGPDVWKIGRYAFRNRYYQATFPKLQNVYTYGSVTHVLRGAFSNQTDLQNIDFKNSVLYCGTGAFAGCINLEYLNFNDEWDMEDISGTSNTTFENCHKLHTISPHNVICKIRWHNYYECWALQKIKIKDVTEFVPGAQYQIGAYAMYCTLNKGSNLDPDGYFITEVTNVDENVASYSWKGNWQRILVVYYEGPKVKLFHEGKIITIEMYETGDLPLKHDDVWWFLRWAEGHENPTHSCLHVAHNGKWYQIKY